MDWIGNFFLILGMWLMGSKKRIGFIFGALGNFLWVMIGFQADMNALAFIAIVMTIFNVRGWINWGKENKYWQSLVVPEKRIKWWQIWR